MLQFYSSVLVRQILYEEPKEDEALKEGTEKKRTNAVKTSAYDHYKTYSPTKQQIWQMRREANEQIKVNPTFHYLFFFIRVGRGA